MATKRNQPHRSGAVVMRGAEKRPTEDQQLLQQEGADSDFVKTDTWRALRILGEFVEGFDALAGEYGDMFKKGIVDAAKVTRSALQNAASIAAMVLTTETLVTDIPEKQSAAAGGGHGHGGGGDMDF